MANGLNGIAKVLRRSFPRWDSNPAETVRSPVQAHAQTHSVAAAPCSQLFRIYVDLVPFVPLGASGEQYAHAKDRATIFNDAIYEAANEVVSKCVYKKQPWVGPYPAGC